MLIRRALGRGLLAAAGLALVGCQLFAVRMPSRAMAGESITITMDVRSSGSDSSMGTHCARLPSSWVVNQATYARNIGGVTAEGTLSLAAASATALNGSAPLAGHTWVCYRAGSASYEPGDYGTARWRVTVQTPGSYDLLFGVVATDGSGTLDSSGRRNFVVDGLPDWRFEAQQLASPSNAQTWTSIESVSNQVLVAVDSEGAAHVTDSGGAVWADRDVATVALNAIDRLGVVYIAVGFNGVVYTAANPLGAWALRTSGTANELNDVCTTGTTAFIVGDGGYVATSTNGTSWLGTTVASVGDVLSCATLPDGGAYAVTSTGHVFRVTAGPGAPTVSELVRPTTVRLSAIAYIATPVAKLLAIGADQAFESVLPSGTWTAVAAPGANAWNALRVVDGTAYAVGASGAFASSPTGSFAWSSYGTGTTLGLNDIAVTGQIAVLVGDAGVRLRAGIPELAFDGTALTLPRTAPGVPAQSTIVFRNAGKGTLYTNAPTATPPFSAEYVCDGALLESDECEVTVTLATSTRGVHTGTLTVPSNSPLQRSVALQGLVGNDATIAVTLDGATAVTAIDFGNAPVGAPVTRTALVLNAGDATLSVGAVAGLVTPRAPFAIADNQCSGQTLAPGATCPITVRFQPFGQEGAAQAFDIASSDPAHPSIFVQLVGVGTPPADIRLPTALAFPETRIDDASDVALLITNVGRGPLDVRSVSVAEGGGAFSVVDDAPFTVAPGESAERMIRFSPTAEGELLGRLVLTSNDADAGEQGVTMTAIALAKSGDDAKDDGGCAAVGPHWLTLLAICACAACRCVGPRRHRRAPSRA